MYLAVISILLTGFFLFPLFMFVRMLKAMPTMDRSNITNALRVLSHITIHTPDLTLMRYEDGSRPFWYLTEDEFKGVVKTRPPK